MARSWTVAVAMLGLWTPSAVAIDVTGNWTLPRTPLTRISGANFIQAGSTLTLCVSGVGTLATGAVDPVTGDFVLTIDPSFADGLYEFGVCSLEWSGTFAPDGESFIGEEAYSLGCFPYPCCLPFESKAISGSRTSTTVACCGNGVVEPGEQCDTRVAIDCCANDCTFEPAGHFCGAIDQCNLRECNANGVCEGLETVDCGTCSRCDPVAGCRADIRSDCRIGGGGSWLQAVGKGTATQFNWHWREDEPTDTTIASFGDPTADTSYELCIFTKDLVASGFARLQSDLGATEACDGSPCWTPMERGFRYRDIAGSAAGVNRVTLTARDLARSSIRASGVARNLSPPLAEDVIVQLSGDDATAERCWSSTFSDPRVNSRGRYVAIQLRTPNDRVNRSLRAR